MSQHPIDKIIAEANGFMEQGAPASSAIRHVATWCWAAGWDAGIKQRASDVRHAKKIEAELTAEETNPRPSA